MLGHQKHLLYLITNDEIQLLTTYNILKGNSAMNTTINPQNTDGTSTVDTSIQLENRQFTYKELEEITNNFQREIGRGGFGVVYSGFMIDGTQVAVKLRSQASTHGVKEFMVEVWNFLTLFN